MTNPYSELDENEWHELWLKQSRQNDLSELPLLVPEDVQRRLHGTVGEGAILGALKFRRVLRHNLEFAGGNTLLDFGCGWGRHIRVFLKDFDAENIFAVDIDQDNLNWVNQYLPSVNVVKSDEAVPLPIETGSIDRIISFSVFSHINEQSANFWLNELHRVLSDDGMLVVTSWGKLFFEIAEKVQRTGEYSHEWEKHLLTHFDDLEKVAKDYAAGNYIFCRHGSTGGRLDEDVFGIALAPVQWFENTGLFSNVTMLDDPNLVPQNTFLLQK